MGHRTQGETSLRRDKTDQRWAKWRRNTTHKPTPTSVAEEQSVRSAREFQDTHKCAVAATERMAGVAAHGWSGRVRLTFSCLDCVL